MSDCVREFRVLGESWYGDANRKFIGGAVEEINIGMYDPSGGCKGEFCLTFHRLGDQVCARLECFEDGWSVLLRDFADLCDKLGGCRTLSVGEAKRMMVGLGIVDATQRTFATDKGVR